MWQWFSPANAVSNTKYELFEHHSRHFRENPVASSDFQINLTPFNLLKKTLTTFAIIVLCWIAGNLIHWSWISYRYKIWNKKITRNNNGLLEHANSFTCGQGTTALIFIHGFADLPYGWKRIAERLTESHSFTSFVMRVPPWGQTLSSQHQLKLNDIRSAIDSKIAEAAQSHTDIWLIGHSMGAAFIIDALPRNNESVTGIVALAPLIRISNKRVPVGTAEFWYHLGTKVLWLARTFESPFTERITAADDADFNYAVDKFIPYSVYNSLFAVTGSNRNITIPKNTPVFCALSSQDKVIDNKYAKSWFDSLQGPKELYLDNVANHALHVGENWQELTDKIAVFILQQTKTI